jgi:hypothetical protein
MVSDDVEVLIYDKDFQRVGFLGDPLVLTATPRHNQQPTGSITLVGNHRKIPLLYANGSRCVIRYRDEHMIGGPVRLRGGDGSGPSHTVTFQIEDDWRLLNRIVARQVPGSPITDQSAAEYRTLTGPAETVVKTLLGAEITRLGLPVTVATDLGRGDTIEVRARMDKPADVLFPLVDQAGIGVSVQQSGAGYVLDCYEPVTWPINLSEEGGTILDGSWSLLPPEMTRVVGMFDGEATARNYRQLVDADLEAEWGDVIEGVIDARDLKHDDAGFEAAATARMQEALAGAAAKAGLSLTLAETSVFQYGGTGTRRGVHVGDRVTAELAVGVTHTDVLREATLTWSKDGRRITPVVGVRRDDPNTAIVRAVSALGRAVRVRNTRS